MIKLTNIIKTLLAGTLAIYGTTAFAQSIHTDNPTVDLGQILYFHNTMATYSLKNRTSHPIKIKDVDTGCGCTTASYPKGMIAPGEEFKVNVTYDGKQLGHFQRYIIITDDSGDIPTELTLKGNVVMEVENFTGEYPLALGNLLADKNNIEFDDVHKGERIIHDIHIMNPSGQYVEPVALHAPNYLKAEIIPNRLAPKSNGILRLTLDSRQLRSYGLNQTSIYLASAKGEKVSEDKEITISAVLLPPAIAQDDATQYKYGPSIKLSKTVIDMSDFQGKSKKKDEIMITNTGRTTLEISSMQMFTPGLQVTLPKRKLEAGESVKMKITGIASQLKKVRTRPRILMITNDAKHQKVVIEIKNK